MTKADGKFFAKDKFLRRQSPSKYCARVGSGSLLDDTDSFSTRSPGTRRGRLLPVLKLKQKYCYEFTI